MNSPLTATCMHCREPVTDDFVLDNTSLTWRTKEYKKYRENLLLDMEKARLPDTQQYAAAVVNARKLVGDMTTEINRLQALIKPAQVAAAVDTGDSEALASARLAAARVRRAAEITVYGLKNDLSTAKRTRAIAKSVLDLWGRARQGGGVAVGAVAEPVRRPMVKACPANGCRGFLSEEFSCAMCEAKVCKECHEIVTAASASTSASAGDGEAEHTCNPDTVASVKALRAESRPCPTCAASISKIDGCDQMWCTQCQTTFSWRTGLKEAGHTHNPHYYEFMRRNGGMPRAPGDVPGGGAAGMGCGMPDARMIMGMFRQDTAAEYNKLTQGWRHYSQRQLYTTRGWPWPPAHHRYAPADARVPVPLVIAPWAVPEDLSAPLAGDLAYMVALSTYHRHIIHMNRVEAQRLTTVAPDNHDLRVQFMLNDLAEDKMRITLQRRDKAYRKDLAKRQIYDMVYQASTDIFRNLAASVVAATAEAAGGGPAPYHSCYTQLLNLMKYANGCFDRLEGAYTCITQKYHLNPFEVEGGW